MESRTKDTLSNGIGYFALDVDFAARRFHTDGVAIMNAMLVSILRMNKDHVFRYQLDVGGASRLSATVVVFQIPIGGQDIRKFLAIGHQFFGFSEGIKFKQPEPAFKSFPVQNWSVLSIRSDWPLLAIISKLFPFHTFEEGNDS